MTKTRVINNKLWIVASLSVLVILFVVMILALIPKNDNNQSAPKIIHSESKSTQSTITQTKTENKVGVILPLTGQMAEFGLDIVDGISLFSDDYPNIKFIIEDDTFDPKESLTAYNKLREIDGVNYFIGPLGPVTTDTIYSSMSEKEKQETFMLPITLCVDKFKEYTNIICTYPGLATQIDNGVKFIISRSAKKAYFVTEHSPLGVEAEKIFRDKSKQYSLSVVGAEKIDFIKEKAYYTYATKIISAKPDAVFLASSNPAAVFSLIKELKTQKYEGVIAANVDAEESLVKMFGDVLEGVYFPGFISERYEEKFTRVFQEKYNKKPNLYNAYGYETAVWIYELSKTKLNQQNSKTSNPKNLKDAAISYQNDNEIAIPGFVYDEEGMVSISFEPKVVRDKKLVALDMN